MTKEWIRQILSGEKRLLQKASVKHVDVGFFPEISVKHMYKGGVSFNSNQDTQGGIMVSRWQPSIVPSDEDMEALEFARKTKGSWIERARKCVKLKFESGQTTVVRQPRIVNNIVTYAGNGTKKGPREKDGLGPSWRELYVGQRVTFTHDAIARREIYGIRDSAGVHERREKGDTIYKARQECTGVVIDAVEDMELQTDVTYAPGKKTTNYVCYPGGGSYVRWDLTKEITLNWTDRLVPTEDGNEIDDIERRTDYIERQDWSALDAELGQTRKKLAQLPEKFVLILRDKAMQARIRAHYNKLHRSSKEAIQARMQGSGGGVEQMLANLKAKQGN